MALTAQQIIDLRARCFADGTAAPLISAGNANGLFAYLRGTSAFIVYKTTATLAQVGQAFNSTEVAGLTTANTSRLQVYALYSGGSFQPNRADTRAGFDDVFSGAGGANTRTALAALWRRAANHAERLLATGTGTTQAPGDLTFEGEVTNNEATRLIFKDDGTIWTS